MCLLGLAIGFGATVAQAAPAGLGVRGHPLGLGQGPSAGTCRVQRQVDCDFGDADVQKPADRASKLPGGPKRRRVAVLMVGVKERFYPMPTLQHVLAPAVRAGHKVTSYSYRAKPPII